MKPSDLFHKQIAVPYIPIPRPQSAIEADRNEMIVTLEKRRARLARERRRLLPR